ncbi:uncharacterized protein LOC134773248 [Penaeus indicus]|uniref:uncharacterized protein LOC134773248 n=1 Tax=Penaeus indicus TaxID=29960 RepID=UPI00300C010F
MSQHAGDSPALQSCSSLASLCQVALEKLLLQAFCLLGKLEAKSKPVRHVPENAVVSFLCQKERDVPLAEIQAYLSSMPTSCRQGMVNNMLNALATPRFDKNSLICNIEFKFQILNIVIGASEMRQVLKKFFQCMLLGYVTSLDFGGFYSFGSWWIAKARRILLSWDKMHGGGEYIEGIDSGKVSTVQLESLWHDMGHEYITVANAAAVNSVKYFHHLTRINIDHVASGELIWAIGCNCPVLEELSIYVDTLDRRKYSTHFEEEFLDGLSALYGHRKYTQTSFRGKPVGCPKIRRIIMPTLQIQEKMEKCSGKLLCYLHHLEELINVGTTGSIVAMFKEKDYNYRPLSLTYVDDARAPETLDVVCRHFSIDIKRFLPNVTSVKMRKTHCGMRLLLNFPLLKELELLTVEDGELEFGSNFAKLTHFKGNFRWDEKRLAAFSQKAPRLETIFFLCGSLFRHKTKKTREKMSFPKARVVKFFQLTHIESDPVINFLKSTKVLTHLFFEDNEKRIGDKKPPMYEAINDKAIASIAPSLKNLVCFHARVRGFRGVCKFSLTKKSVHSLLASCPNLTDLGNLFHWDIPYQDVLALKKQAKEGNWKIGFTPPDDV